MNLLDKARALAQLARWGVMTLWYDTRYPSPVPDNAKFMSPRDAVRLIRDGDVIAASGLGGHQRASILYWAIRERFQTSGHPRRLTVMNLGGHGGRGVVPGTLEELGQPGLCTRFITGHFETFRAMLDLGAKGQCELQCVPQGILALLFDALGHGRDSVVTTTGIGTFIDPRVGRGSPVVDPRHEQLVTVRGNRLCYRIPPIDVALFNVPAADRKGNLYVKRSAMIGESRELARAAKRHGGRVIANVGLVVDAGYDHVFLPARMVDAIVYYPNTEQTGGFFHSDPWSAVTTESDVPIGEALAYARFVGSLLPVVGRRTGASEVLARLAAATLAANIQKGACVGIGVGLPEEVAPVFLEAGRLEDITFLVESGIVGGLPAPGVYFGAAFSPQAMISSAEMFKRCYRHLDATCLGGFQVDGEGNVNVSRRGDGVRDFGGPGGFMDFSAAAQTIVFVTDWMVHGEMAVDHGRLRITKRGTPKFTERVAEVSFNGRRALRAGKQVFYVTPVGVFHLTGRGVELTRAMPGVDVRRDIVDATSMNIVLPKSGRVPLVPDPILTGQGFKLRFASLPRSDP